MLKFLYFTIIALILTGCMTTNRLDKLVTHKTSSHQMQVNVMDSSRFVLNTNRLASTEKLCESKHKSFFIIPAIVFWWWKNDMKCKINNHYFINQFTEVLNRKANDEIWKDKLKDKKLEISLDSVPNQFNYVSDGVLLFLFTEGYTYSHSEVLRPENQVFRVSYRLLQNDIAIKVGSFWTKYTKPEYNTNQSDKQFVEKFLDIQSDFFTTESENLILQIAKDL